MDLEEETDNTKDGKIDHTIRGDQNSAGDKENVLDEAVKKSAATPDGIPALAANTIPDTDHIAIVESCEIQDKKKIKKRNTKQFERRRKYLQEKFSSRVAGDGETHKSKDEAVLNEERRADDSANVAPLNKEHKIDSPTDDVVVNEDHGAMRPADAVELIEDHGTDRLEDAVELIEDDGADRPADAVDLIEDHGADRPADAVELIEEHGAERPADAVELIEPHGADRLEDAVELIEYHGARRSTTDAVSNEPENQREENTHEAAEQIRREENDGDVDTENIEVEMDDEDGDLFGILTLYANSSLHSDIDMAAIFDNNKDNDDYGYVYFSLSTMLNYWI